MKKLYYAIGVLLLLSIVSTAVIVTLSPDVIPAHYNVAGQVDRFGSKYENFIFPGFALAMTGFLLLLQQYQKKKNAPETEQKILLGTTVFSLLLFNVLGLYFGIAGIRYADDVAAMRTDILVKIISIGMGALLVVLGNIMPKVRRNALIGLRTKWSMANDRVWQKCQRFGGFSAVICGLVMIVLAVLAPESWNVAVLFVAVFVWVVVCIVASSRYWKIDREKHGDAQDGHAKDCFEK